jgi:hypothetical protein
MMAINTAIGAATAIESGNPLSFVGAVVGGAVFGGIGKSLASSIASTMTKSFANSFIGGAIIGGVEFGIAGFGAGLGAGLASGQSFPQALKSAGIGAGLGAVTGAIIEGSYMAGWQNSMHGLSKGEIEAARNAQRGSRLFKLGKFLKNVGPDRERAQAYYFKKAIVGQSSGLVKEYHSFIAKNALQVDAFKSPIKDVMRHNMEVNKWLQPDDIVTDIYGIEKLEAFNDARRYMILDPDKIYGRPVDMLKDAFKIAY